jgi:hypothetical protein
MKIKQEVIEALREAANVIDKFEMVTSKSNLPDTFRFPMIDELYGLALILEVEDTTNENS